MAELLYWVNGQLTPADRAALPLNDLGIVRGYGVFDLLRTYGRAPFRLGAHLQRLASSAQQIGLTLPWSQAELDAIVHETLAANGLADVAVRIVATGGPSDNFMMPQGRPSLAVMIHPITPYPASYYTQGCKAASTRIERIMPTVKSLNYIGAIMAVRTANAAGAVEAIYRDAHDHITEGTRANFFVFRGDTLITPAAGILKGITRQAVLEAAAGLFPVVEAPIAYADLRQVDEAFLTSTTKEVLPIVQVDDQQIGAGAPGPNTQRLMARFRELVQAECAAVAI